LKENSGAKGLNQESLDGRGMWHVWGSGEVHTGFWWGQLRERDHLEDLGVDGRQYWNVSYRNSLGGSGL